MVFVPPTTYKFNLIVLCWRPINKNISEFSKESSMNFYGVWTLKYCEFETVCFQKH